MGSNTYISFKVMYIVTLTNKQYNFIIITLYVDCKNVIKFELFQNMAA